MIWFGSSLRRALDWNSLQVGQSFLRNTCRTASMVWEVSGADGQRVTTGFKLKWCANTHDKQFQLAALFHVILMVCFWVKHTKVQWGHNHGLSSKRIFLALNILFCRLLQFVSIDQKRFLGRDDAIQLVFPFLYIGNIYNPALSWFLFDGEINESVGWSWRQHQYFSERSWAMHKREGGLENQFAMFNTNEQNVLQISCNEIFRDHLLAWSEECVSYSKTSKSIKP